MERNRKSQRKSGYDYSTAGFYFITICTIDRLAFFGEVVNDKMIYSDAGKMIIQIWGDMPKYYPSIRLDLLQVMPNHLHGIIIIKSVGAGLCARPNMLNKNGRAQRPAPTVRLSLSEIIGRYKSITTSRYIDGVKHAGWKPFPGYLWQRNFYDHIIRNKRDLTRIRTYIINNPKTWDADYYSQPSCAKTKTTI